jgi:hypothetical protein
VSNSYIASTATTSSLSNPASFYQAARWQRVCAVCGRASGRPDARGRTWHAHHVVPKPILRRLHLPEYDTRGALRLCTDCHMAFEWAGPGKVHVMPKHMTDENICYVWEVLGVAVVQIERKYGVFDADPRWHRHRMGECELCQLR